MKYTTIKNKEWQTDFKFQFSITSFFYTSDLQEWSVEPWVFPHDPKTEGVSISKRYSHKNTRC